MENEKKIEKTEGIAFQQPEPEQLNEADLQSVAGGAVCDSDSCGCNDSKSWRK